MTTTGLPQIELSVRLPATLSSVVDASSSRIRAAVERAANTALERLGVPGTVSVTVSAAGPEAQAGGKTLLIAADERPVRYPVEMLQRAWCYLAGSTLDPQVTPSFIEARLLDGQSALNDAEHEEHITRFLALACTKIVEFAPSRLMGPAQCAAYAERLGIGLRLEGDILARVLRQVLDLHMSIANHQAVAGILAGASTETEAAEALATALRRDSIDILLAKFSLRELTTALAGIDSSTAFPLARDGMFEELGVSTPKYRFVIDDEQGPGSFAFRVNDFTSIPVVQLPPGRLMVNDTVERLRLAGLGEGTAISNPATGQPNTLIDAAQLERAHANKLTTWNGIEHLILSFAEFLRRFGWCTIHRGSVQRQLTDLSLAFPALVKLAQSRRSDDYVTALVRALARERVSVQNLRAILEGMLDVDEAGRGELEVAVPADSDAGDALSKVRTALGATIAHQAARGTDTIVAYLLDPAIERQAGQPPSEFDRHGEEILVALRKELAYLPATAQVPSLLTAKSVRLAVQQLVASEYPRMSVLAHEEMPAGRNIQPVARIAL